MSSLVKIKLFCLNWLSRPLIRFVVLPGAVVYEALSYLSNNQEKNSSLAILTPSLLTALVGWLNSASLSHKCFVKTENSKAKDAISLFVDKFFDDYEEKIKSTSFHNQAEDFIAGKVTILELRLKHLKDRTGIELVSAEYLSKLRQIPCDDFSDSSIPKKISNLRFDVLEHIETNYSRWFPTEKI